MAYPQNKRCLAAFCSQTLLVSLWIRCMESSVAQQLWCLAAFDQKTISDFPDIYASRQTFQSPLRYFKQFNPVGNLWRLIF